MLSFRLKKQTSKNIVDTTFKEELGNKFEKIFISTLDKHAPLRKKVLRANHAPYMTKTLRKGIMGRSQLQTKQKKVMH